MSSSRILTIDKRADVDAPERRNARGRAGNGPVQGQAGTWNTAADPKVRARTGMLFGSWELGRDYGLTDHEGRRPDWGRRKIDFFTLPPTNISISRPPSRVFSCRAMCVNTPSDGRRHIKDRIPAEVGATARSGASSSTISSAVPSGPRRSVSGLSRLCHDAAAEYARRCAAISNSVVPVT